MDDSNNRADYELAASIKAALDQTDAESREWFVSGILASLRPAESALDLHRRLVAHMQWGTSPEYLQEAEGDGENPIDSAEEFVNLLKTNARAIGQMLLRFADNPLQSPEL